MTGVVHIDIQESVEELEGLVRQQKNARLKERIQALYLIKAHTNSQFAIRNSQLKNLDAAKLWEFTSVSGFS